MNWSLPDLDKTLQLRNLDLQETIETNLKRLLETFGGAIERASLDTIVSHQIDKEVEHTQNYGQIKKHNANKYYK